MENENMVASIPDEQLVDDTQAVESISAEELVQSLNGDDGRTADENGDGGHAERKPDGNSNAGRDSKSSQIRAALRSQREQIFKDLGMTETEVRDLIRNHKAQEMNKADPEISIKAATEILKARENSVPDRHDEIARDIETLREDGWTDQELQALATDEGVLDAMRNGKTLRQAARAYEKAQRQPAAREQKRAVPTVRGAASAGDRDISDYIQDMSPEEFRKFQRRVHDMQMRGRSVRF